MLEIPDQNHGSGDFEKLWQPYHITRKDNQVHRLIFGVNPLIPAFGMVVLEVRQNTVTLNSYASSGDYLKTVGED